MNADTGLEVIANLVPGGKAVWGACFGEITLNRRLTGACCEHMWIAGSILDIPAIVGVV